MFKLPCLAGGQPQYARVWGTGTDIGAIWRWAVVLVVLPDLVEVIFVQLPDKARKVAVLEVFWEDQLGEFLVLPLVSVSCGGMWCQPSIAHLQNHKALSAFSPAYDAFI